MRIFITGATGYIGGSVAQHLRRAGHTVVGLSRRPEKAAELRTLGIEPVLGDLDDAAILAEQAREADAVVNAADSDHRGAAEALVAALSGSDKALLHTSGSSIVAEDARGEATEATFTEDRVTPGGDWVPAPDKAARVAIDRLVLAAAEQGVRSVVLCNSMIYGHGRGLARDSVQVPRLVRQARSSGVVRHIGAGRNKWSNVHLDDMAELYLRALSTAPAGSFFFVENGEAAYADITRAIAEVLDLGAPQSWDIESAVAEWGYEPAVYALGSNSRVRTVRAGQQLGWRPRHDSVVDWIHSGLLNDTMSL